MKARLQRVPILFILVFLTAGIGGPAVAGPIGAPMAAETGESVDQPATSRMAPSEIEGFSAPPVVGPEIPFYRPNNQQYLPAVAYNSRHDEYLIVWHNLWISGSRNIYAQRISGQGEILSWFTIAGPGNDRAQPSVAYDPEHDRYLVTYIYDQNGNGSDWNVYGRFIPWNWPDEDYYEFPICTWATHQWNPQVVYNENPERPEFLVVWWTSTSSVPAYVSARRVLADATGFPSGDGFTVASDPLEDYTNPDVAYNLARNEYLVVYDKNSYDILATRLEANGNLLDQEISVATWPDSESIPSVAACHTADQYFVAWQSLQDTTPPHWDIYGRFVNGDGTTADVLHITDWIGAAHERNPDVACNAGAGHYLVAWEQQYLNLIGPYGIWGRLVHTDKTQDAKFEIAQNVDPYDCRQPAVAAGPPSYMVAWEHERSGTSYQDIHARLVWPAAVYLPLVLRR